MEGRASLAKRCLPLIRELPAGVFQELMFRALAERTGLELNSLMRLEAQNVETPPQAPQVEAPAPGSPPPDDGPPPEAYDGYDATDWPQSEPAPEPPAERPRGGATETLAQAAIALLLHKPAVAERADAEALSALPGQEGELLREMLRLLHKRPESSTGMLLGHWYGTAEGELLAQLAGQERLIPPDGIEQQFDDIIRRLSSMPLRERIVAEIGEIKGRPFDALGDEDKTRLRELIRALRDLDARTAPGAPPA